MANQYEVVLENIKGIKKLVFPFPYRKGVYLLAGSNGCGKTSLLISLCRLGDKLAFTQFRVNSQNGNGLKIDTYQNASITYRITNNTDESIIESVTYNRSGVRWVPTPRTKTNLLQQFPFTSTKFISTAGMRFFSQEILSARRQHLNAVSDDFKNNLNEIFGTTRFNNLRYLTVKSKKGRQRALHRGNKLYVIQNGANIYSEQNFSLGEKLLINTLDYLQNIPSRTLLLIDEIELALHPVAQIKFYEYLKRIANEKELAVIISTHSSSLINHSENLLYLERNSSDEVIVIDNCRSSYILRNVASFEDCHPDFIFFVEDDMARRYLHAILRKFDSDSKKHIDIKILPVGGYEQVVTLTQEFPAISFDKQKIQAFLDADVKDTFDIWESKGNSRTPSEEKKYKLFQENSQNISYLSITPELGIWQWIESNPTDFKQFFEDRFGNQTFRIEDKIADTSNAEAGNKTAAIANDNLRSWAKGCFKNFKERINTNNPTISEKEIENCMIDAYVSNNYSRETVLRKIMPIINRR